RLGPRHRPYRHAQVRDAGPPRVLRRRRALAGTLRLPAARPADAVRGSDVVKLTLAWLKEHRDTATTLDGIVERLTMIGLEVESVHDPAAQYAPFKIARVLSAEKHPNADRLKVCVVDPGDGSRVQVVCGAPNAH